MKTEHLRPHPVTIPTPQRATGSHFYRYSRLQSNEHLDWLKAIILKHELYLPSLIELNDPSDGRPKLSSLSIPQLVSYLQDSWCEGHPNATDAEKEDSKQVLLYNLPRFGNGWCIKKLSQSLNEQLKGYRIYSMSKRYDNLSMWAKYADNHSGYCLEFVNEGPLFEHALEVIYTDAIEMDVTNPKHRTGYFFFCKNPDWSNEEEVRLILARNCGTKVKIEPRWLTRIILGWRILEKHQTLIREWARQRVPELGVVNAYYDELDQKLKLGSDFGA